MTKCDRQINLAEKIEWSPSVQSVGWVPLVTFSQMYSENQKQRTQKKILENLNFDAKEIIYKFGAKERTAVGISTIKTKLLCTVTRIKIS